MALFADGGGGSRTTTRPRTFAPSITGGDALQTRLEEILKQQAAGDPAFQTGSKFFTTKLGSAVEQALGTGATDDENSFFTALAEIFRAQASASLASDATANALAREQLDLERARIAEEARQFNQALAEEKRATAAQLAEDKAARAFEEKDIVTGRNIEASGLATGPTGAIQLAHLARGEGAPQADVAAIFQNLPFVQALLRGEALPGFGLSGQLGGDFNRVPGVGTGNVIEGKNLGVNLPSKTAITEQMFRGMSVFEQQFLGALGQSETGQSSAGFLEDITKSFIPTTTAFSF